MGGVHGLLQIAERALDKHYSKLSETVRWIYTFSAVNVLWLLFRSDSVVEWLSILHKIMGFQDMSISEGLINSFVLPEIPFLLRIFHLSALDGPIRGFSMLLFMLAGFLVCLVPENNYRNKEKLTACNCVLSAIALTWGILCLGSESVFVYYNF